MKTKYTTYEELLKREQFISNLKENRVELLFKKNRVKLIVGGICLFIAILPNGTAPLMFPLGFMLLGISIVDIHRKKENLFRKVRYWIIQMKGGLTR